MPEISVNPAPPTVEFVAQIAGPTVNPAPPVMPEITVNPAPPAVEFVAQIVEATVNPAPPVMPEITVNPAPPAVEFVAQIAGPTVNPAPPVMPEISVNSAPPSVEFVAPIAGPTVNPASPEISVNPAPPSINSILEDDPFICFFPDEEPRSYNFDKIFINNTTDQSMQDFYDVLDFNFYDFLDDAQGLDNLLFIERYSDVDTAKPTAVDNLQVYDAVLMNPVTELVTDQITVE